MKKPKKYSIPFSQKVHTHRKIFQRLASCSKSRIALILQCASKKPSNTKVCILKRLNKGFDYSSHFD